MMTLQHPIKLSSSVRDRDGIPLALAKTEDGGERVVVWKGIQWEPSKGNTVSEVLRYPEASPEFLMEVGIIVNKTSGFYILKCSNDIFDCKTDKQKISYDKYYIGIDQGGGSFTAYIYNSNFIF